MATLHENLVSWLDEPPSKQMKYFSMREPRYRHGGDGYFNKIFFTGSPDAAAETGRFVDELLFFSKIARSQSDSLRPALCRSIASFLKGHEALHPKARVIAITADASTALQHLAHDNGFVTTKRVVPSSRIEYGRNEAYMGEGGWSCHYRPPIDPKFWHGDNYERQLAEVRTCSSLHSVGAAAERVYSSDSQVFGMSRPGLDDDAVRYGRFSDLSDLISLTKDSKADDSFTLHHVIYVGIVNPVEHPATSAINSAHLFDLFHGIHPDSAKLVTIRLSRSLFRRWFAIAGDTDWLKL